MATVLETFCFLNFLHIVLTYPMVVMIMIMIIITIIIIIIIIIFIMIIIIIMQTLVKLFSYIYDMQV